MDTNIQSAQTSGNPQGHLQTASPAGNGQPEVPEVLGIGAFNSVGKTLETAIAKATTVQQGTGIEASPQQTQQTAQVQPGQNPGGQQQASRQLTEKDARHFAQFVTEASQEKYNLAKIAVEANEDAIYDIAKSDKGLAERLLKEYDFGATSVDELLDNKRAASSKNPEETASKLAESRRLEQVERDLMEEKLLRLKGENPDLQGDVETKFREIYNDPAFSKYNEKQKIAFAKVAAGQSDSQSNADNVALAVLKAQEGAVTSPRGVTSPDKMRAVTPEMRKMMQAANLTEKDLDLLPGNIDELVSSMYGPLVGR